MATKQELENQLAAIQGGLLDMTEIGEKAFFAQTEEKKITKQEVPRYTDIYNQEFQKVKDVLFELGEDVTTQQKGDIAFYSVAPVVRAERETRKKIGSIELTNLQEQQQQERIKTFLKGESEAAKIAVFEEYLTTRLPTKPGYKLINMSDPVQVELFRNTPTNKRLTEIQTFQFGNQKMTTSQNYIKVSAEEYQKELNTIRQIEQIRFETSPELQKKFAKITADKLQAKIKSMK